MNPTEIEHFISLLDQLRNSHENYRLLQEQEHSHLSRRGSMSEWNTLVRKKDAALQEARSIEKKMSLNRQRWQQLGENRTQPQYAPIREKLSQLQTLLTRNLTCDRMNEVLLYNGGYLQSVVAYRSAKQEKLGVKLKS
jgi:hypothetical protein